jgi:hypothetical protein
MKNTSIMTFVLIMISASVFAQGYRVNRTHEKTRPKLKSSGLGKNIIAFSPVTLAFNSMMDYGGYGGADGNVAMGMSYERIFDNEHLSVKLPVSFTIEKPGIYLMPAIKFYPKKQGAVKYAVGPQFLISYVEDYYHTYYPQSGNYVGMRETRRQFGFGLNNSLNFTISRHLYAAMDANLGILYYDSFNGRGNLNSYYNNDMVVGLDLNQSFSCGFSIGCRF